MFVRFSYFFCSSILQWAASQDIMCLWSLHKCSCGKRSIMFRLRVSLLCFFFCFVFFFECNCLWNDHEWPHAGTSVTVQLLLFHKFLIIFLLSISERQESYKEETSRFFWFVLFFLRHADQWEWNLKKGKLSGTLRSEQKLTPYVSLYLPSFRVVSSHTQFVRLLVNYLDQDTPTGTVQNLALQNKFRCNIETGKSLPSFANRPKVYR